MTAATPDAAAAAPCSAARTSKRSRCAARSAANGRDPRALADYSKALSQRSFGPATAKYRELGTATNLLTFNRLGALPTRNFQSGTFDGAAALSPEEIRQTHSRTRASCVACTIGCEHIYWTGGDEQRRPARV